MNSIKSGSLKVLVLLTGYMLLGTAYGAKVKVLNKTAFKLKIEYYAPQNKHLKTRVNLDAKKEKLVDTGLIVGDYTYFYLENVTPYSEKAKKEMNGELQVGMSYTSAATLAVCAMAPLLAPPVAIAGTLLVSAKYYFDSLYFNGILIPNELPENTELILTVEQENSRKFHISSEIVDLDEEVSDQTDRGDF